MRASTDSFSFCTCQVFCCQVFLRCHGDDLSPLKCVAKPETFQSLSLTTRPDCCLFNGAELCSLFGDAALRGTQITANTRNAFPPGGLWRLRGKKKKKKQGVSQGAACVRYRTCPGFFFFFFLFLQSASDDMCTQTRGLHGRIDRVSVLSDADDSRDTPRKRINCPFLHKHGGDGGGVSRADLTETDMLWS